MIKRYILCKHKCGNEAVDWCWEGQGEINMAVISGHICIDLSSGTARVHLGQGGIYSASSARRFRG